MQDCEVSVLIPVKNGGELFRRCLSMVLSQRTSFVFEVIVIDSGSTDGSLEFMVSLSDPRLTVTRIDPAHFNHGETRNQAARMSKGKLLVFLVQDAEPGSVGWLETLVSRMADSSLAGVFARQLPRSSSGYFVKRGVDLGPASSPHPRKASLSSWSEFEALTPMERYLRCFFDNVCSCIRRSDWEADPFEKVNFGEDILWARKALFRGRSLAYEPAAFVYHSHDRSMLYLFKRICLDHWNLYQYFGMETVPRFWFALSTYLRAVPYYWALLKKAQLPVKTKMALLPEIVFRPLAEIGGQYWGVRLARQGRQPRFRGV